MVYKNHKITKIIPGCANIDHTVLHKKLTPDY